MLTRHPIRIANRTIGLFDEVTQTFEKTIQGSKHILRKLDAIGIDGHYFTTLIETRCKFVRVTDSETGRIYFTTPAGIRKHGEFKHYKPHRAQIFLARKYWFDSLEDMTNAGSKEVKTDE